MIFKFFKNKYSLFIIEIGIEDLPYSKSKYICDFLLEKYKNNLYKNNLFFKKINIYYSSRRISIISKKLYRINNNIYEIIRGPSLKNLSYNNIFLKFNNWIKKYNLNLNNIKYLIKDNNIFFINFLKINKKYNIKKILFSVVNNSIIELLNNNLNLILSKDIKFIKPIISISLIIDNDFILGKILEIKLNNFFYGNINNIYKKIYINNSKEYINSLKKYGNIIINNYSRKKIILKKINIILKKYNLYIDNNLIEKNIDIYIHLNEYPSVLSIEFNINYIKNLPKSIIEYIIIYHKFIPTYFSYNNELTNKFILISNIISKKYKNLIYWSICNIHNSLNELCIFFNIDIKNDIILLKEKLNEILFRKKLGSMYEKIYRFKIFSLYLIKKTHKYYLYKYINDISDFYKLDLVTNLGIFYPKLQGIISSIYYKIKKNNNINNIVLNSIKNQYFNENDYIKNNKLNYLTYIISLSDKLDTLIGNFILHKYNEYKITGNNDPLYIKKYSIYIIKILINIDLDIKISFLIKKTLLIYNQKKNYDYLFIKIKKFFINRIINFYLNKNYSINIINSVISCQDDSLFDINLRIKSITLFINEDFNKFINIINTYKRINNLIINNIDYNNNINIKKIYIHNKLLTEIKSIENYLSVNINNRKYLKSLYILNILCKKINIYLDNNLILTSNIFIKNYKLKYLFSIINNFYNIVNFNILKF
ncbi:glycine--tRNA ligase subunit beta [endosymbiont of Pachyrhynchus infernalis]|uniref:glycine--tRNA ligase subunit beta n=1 Tax=endosymbiont of Pachyrhynchus infernalis TaxID=1971488 RepID=UPI000DC72924|nr:glycine--tRNA ligase subunit beta [endosymbiont of Pachyrhynchus infernalis]BBA84791.1 glycine--tRNA ligase beta subunit [endosymbiont of Pachyrhynchus infernalis]